MRYIAFFIYIFLETITIYNSKTLPHDSLGDPTCLHTRLASPYCLHNCNLLNLSLYKPFFLSKTELGQVSKHTESIVVCVPARLKSRPERPPCGSTRIKTHNDRIRAKKLVGAYTKTGWCHPTHTIARRTLPLLSPALHWLPAESWAHLVIIHLRFSLSLKGLFHFLFKKVVYHML